MIETINKNLYLRNIGDLQDFLKFFFILGSKAKVVILSKIWINYLGQNIKTRTE